MTFLRGNVFLPPGTPFREKNPWDYVPALNEENARENLVPLPEALVRVVLPETRSVVTQGLTNDEGEFFVRVPPEAQYLVEVFFGGKLIALAFIEVKEKKELDVGAIDSLSTAYALGKIQESVFRASVSPRTLQKLQREVERLWKKGWGLEKLPAKKGLVTPPPYPFDPFGLIRRFEYFFVPQEKHLVVAWETNEEVEAILYYRSFRARHYSRERSVFGLQGRFEIKVYEFEGYLFYLEVRTRHHLLGRTPVSVARAPILPVRWHMELPGRQEGPLTVTRKEVSGRKTLPFPNGEGELPIALRKALERRFEAEVEFSFPRRANIPRYFIREGFEELELTFYFPEDHSVLWGPVGQSSGVMVAQNDWQRFLGQWEKIVPQFSFETHFLEMGYSTPFVEVVAYRNGEYFRLFTHAELRDPVVILSARSLLSLDLDTVLYYRGKLHLFGEGLFEEYVIELDFEGEFREEVDDHHLNRCGGECVGKVTFWVDLTMRHRDTDKAI